MVREDTRMNEKSPNQALLLIILILGTLTISGCSQGDSLPTHSPVAPTSTFETTPTLEVLTATGITPTLETMPTPEELTATGLTPQENVDRYGIPAVIVPFDYPLQDGMIEDPGEIQAMIKAKITHLEEINRRFYGDAPGNVEQRQEVFEELWGILDEYYVVFNRLDIDWDAFYEENIEAIGNAESYGEYAYVITNMGYVLQEAHTYAVPSRVTYARDRGFLDAAILRYIPWFEASGFDSLLGGCYTVTSEDELVFYQVLEERSNPYHLQIGDEFIGFNGVPWRDWIPAIQASRLPRSGSPAANDDSLEYHLLRSGMQNAQLFEKINIRRVDTGELETFDVIPASARSALSCSYRKSPDGWVATADPNHPVSMEDDDVFVYGILQDENIGYMVLKKFVFPEGFESEFERAVNDLMNTDRLIIDLRGNPGGDFNISDFSALAHLVRGTEDRYFFSWAAQASSSDDRSTLEDVRERWGKDCQNVTSSDRYDEAGLCEGLLRDGYLNRGPRRLRADDPDKFYTKPISVLVGPDCQSACDYLVHVLSQFPEITIIGRNPNGSATSLNIWGRTYDYPELNESVIMWFPAAASYDVNEPSIDHLARRSFVDHEVWLTKEDVKMGIDTVLEYAIQFVRDSS